MDDLIQLILINQLDLNEPQPRAAIVKHGNAELYENYDKPASPDGDGLRDAPGLKFPDWSGMTRRHSRMTFEQAAQWNQEMLSIFPPGKKSPKLEAQSRCYAEFIL